MTANYMQRVVARQLSAIRAHDASTSMHCPSKHTWSDEVLRCLQSAVLCRVRSSCCMTDRLCMPTSSRRTACSRSTVQAGPDLTLCKFPESMCWQVISGPCSDCTGFRESQGRAYVMTEEVVAACNVCHRVVGQQAETRERKSC